MKTFIGILAVLISLAFISLLVLRIWDIQIITLQAIIRSSKTLVVLGIAAVLLIVYYGAFFRSSERLYNEDRGNRAHPKAGQ
ncbi:hypothetical protein [Mucilaginibacter polytrichastri]|uniref:Uncharacterized protein n=1 Tax=Mucilaginibacter polytrichastri TaxID=1302689 RepID=A0A1Q6A0C1_9SPHI|nr:hypothetical protein [Mucilaginibacter polytrichastri]OKS87448.1 hypothetical protein RG47T_2909 [Mucilaginibacter polytrichastri]SFS90767.1 hypothetical protein SAMN04487890_10644 [Mucilaginibacter polytrichastri]